MRRFILSACLSLLFFSLFSLTLAPVQAGSNLRAALLLNVPYTPQGSASRDPAQSCGPAAMAMALSFVTGKSVAVDAIRDQTKHPWGGPTYFDDYLQVWPRYGLQWGKQVKMVFTASDFKTALQNNQVIVAALHYGQNWVSKGEDFGRASSSPEQNVGLFDAWLQENGAPFWGHMVAIIGYGSDEKGQEYFILNDPNDFGQASYKYNNGSPKGRNRWIAVPEVMRAIEGMWTDLDSRRPFALAFASPGANSQNNQAQAVAVPPGSKAGGSQPQKTEAIPQPVVRTSGFAPRREVETSWNKNYVDNWNAPKRISKHRAYLIF